MGDEADYAIETADAGASATIPMEAGQIKKGGYVFFFSRVLAILESFCRRGSIVAVYGGFST